MNREKILFLSSMDPYSKKDWSGIPFFLYQALSKQYDVEYIPLPQFRRIKLLGYYLSRVSIFFSRKKYVFDFGIIMALLYGVSGSLKLKGRHAKFIFSPAGLPEVAFLRTRLPIVSYGDSSTLQLINYYPALMNVSGISYCEIEFVERKAFKRLRLSAFSSTWAVDFVEKKYSTKSYVIPFGSNIHRIEKRLSFRSPSHMECNLLFIGVDWNRKGGDVALEVHRHLLRRGVQSHLTIVGTSPPLGVSLDKHIVVIPNINKDTSKGQELLNQVFESAHFLLLPTTADCTPIVIAEAFSFGLPVLASCTGGIPTMVLENETGFLFKLADSEGYVSIIEQLILDEKRYRLLSDNCLYSYEHTFNWNSWVASLSNLVASNLNETVSLLK